jgi:TonB family protein
MKSYIYPRTTLLMNRVSFFLFFLLSYYYAHAQTITQYYNNNWLPTTKENATFYANFVKDGDVYQCTSYYVASGRIKGRSVYSDTSFGFAEGPNVGYDENGTIEDSAYYNKEGSLVYSYHYHPNGKLAGRFILAKGDKNPEMEGYDEEGKRIKNYIFFREAQFKGGNQKWIAFLSKSLSTEFTANSTTEEEKTVVVEFIVDKSGYVVRPRVFESSGNSALDSDAVSTIQASPQWAPAIQFNKPVNAYRRQPVTYLLYPAAKRK